MENKRITKEYLQTYITERKLNSQRAEKLVNDLAGRGYTIEGFNEPKPTVAQKVTGALKERASNVVEAVKDVGQAQGVTETVAQAGRVPLRVLGQTAGAVGDVIGETVVNPALQATGLDQPLAQGVQAVAESQVGQAVKSGLEQIPQPIKEAVGDIANVAGLVTGGTGAKVAGQTVGKGVVKGAKGVKNTATNVSESVRNLDILPLDAPDNIKTSLNPFLTKTDADISVPTASGYILKKVKDVTPQERVSVQNETSSLYQNLLENAKKFKEDRRDTFSPLEVVGQRTDKALNDVDAFRRQEGKRMGEIEKSLNDQTIDIRGSRIDTFVNEYLGSSKSFGRKTKDTAFVDDFANDYDKLVQNPTVANVLEFTRTWSNELEDLKDGFGAFKDNKRTYTVIEGAISDLKNGARNVISETNPEYKKALANYRLTSQIREEGNRLLGKEGLAGERLKGGAAAKRAVQSSSDAGARQFFNVLKKVTGYDGLKEADIALQAMKDVGDYQGLSLLEVNRDLYQATVGKALSKIPFAEAGVELSKAITSKVVPQEKRVRNLIEKTDVKPSKKVAPTKTSFKDLPNQQGGFISTGATTDLIKEAKKYKSAEEFVNTSQTVFRAGKESKNPAGIFLSKDSKTASKYETLSGEKTKEYTITPNAKLKSAVTRYELLREIDPKFNQDKLMDRLYAEETKAKKEKKAGLRASTLIDGMTPPQRYDTIIEQRIAKKLEGKYDGVIYDSKGTNDQVGEYQIFNKDIVKTKSQLEQIWKEAQKTGGFISTGATTDLIKEAKKYKSAEEFVNSQMTGTNFAGGGGYMKNYTKTKVGSGIKMPDFIDMPDGLEFNTIKLPSGIQKNLEIAKGTISQPASYTQGDNVYLFANKKLDINKLSPSEINTIANNKYSINISQDGGKTWYKITQSNQSQLEQIWKEAQKTGGSTKINPLNAIAGSTAIVAGANAIRNKKSK